MGSIKNLNQQINTFFRCFVGANCTNHEFMKRGAEALKAAGVFMIVAAHNRGPSCSSVMRQPAHYDSVVTIGATDYKSDNIASFSSRGPVTIDGSNRMKPDFCAPGVRILSAYPKNTYRELSGMLKSLRFIML
jgi:serine protease AprX